MKANERHRIKLKIIFLPVAVCFILNIITGLALRHQLSRSFEMKEHHNLMSLANVSITIVNYLKSEPGCKTKINELVHALGTSGEAQLTVINSQGNIIADSLIEDNDLDSAPNQLNSPEIRDAKERGRGFSIRRNNSTGKEMLYIAVPFYYGKNSGYIRAAKDMFGAERDVSELSFSMIFSGIILLFIFTGLCIFTITYLSRSISKEQEMFEQRVTERTSHISALHQLGSMLTACNSNEEAFEVIGKAAKTLLPMFSGALSLYKSSRDILEVAGTWNEEWHGELFYTSNDCWALRTGKNYFYHKEEGIIQCKHNGASDDQLMLCIPMIAQGDTIGVMHIAGNKIEDFTEENKQFAFALSEHASLAIANIQLRESLHQQATRDTLTGLYNRRFLMDYMVSEISRSKRNNKNLSVLMMDLDHFKQLNDSFGHDAGDYILTEFSKALRNSLRLEDIVCRYGGEEFVVLLPEIQLESAVTVAEKLRNVVSNLDLKSGGVSIGGITVSIGVATFPEHGLTKEELIKAADTGLYQAKKEGRNRTVIADIKTA